MASLACAGYAAAAAAADNQSALAPAGIQAARIAHLWNLTLWVCTVTFALVLLALIVALWRSTRNARGARDARPLPATPSVQDDSGPTRAVRIATIVSVLALIGLVTVDIYTDRALSKLPVADAVRIQVVGHQWWWEMRYQDDQGNTEFVTANEMHVPVGRPVIIDLKSPDVIHTFWVPNLHGKKDMIPGRDATLELRADQPGAYRGQCAEFCGSEHALMAFFLTADTPADYEAWRQRRRQPAAPVQDQALQRGQRLFVEHACASCHTVAGTQAAGTVGPDLTHLADRPMLAAGTVANTRDQLLKWISNPYAIKPGTAMPATPLSRQDAESLVSYLESLR
ncbi:cytochrome c oxidase subunit II [Achromobacter aloeverae]|uniref:cytochrome-c oxidase n=2 Tax=Achromobacter aloeverae TaxID=1750518 RepID=A0A4Q1HMT2_9BURK|nr:cytochrome c oxidase subunit II [Achromobacter aloeverae]